MNAHHAELALAEEVDQRQARSSRETGFEQSFDAGRVAPFILADNYTRRIVGYIERGRKFENEPSEALASQLIGLIRAWSLDPLGRPGLAVISDLESEFDLRKIERPYAFVRPELEKISSAISAFARSLDEHVLEERARRLTERYKAARRRML